MTAFAEFFKLKKKTRNDFRLDPDVDAHLYVDLDQILGKIDAGLAATAPKGVIEGGFGTGKSHVLHHIQRVLAPNHAFEPVYISLSGFNRKSDFYSVHGQIIAELLPFVEKLLQGGAQRRNIVHEIPYITGDMKIALEGLSMANIGAIPQSDFVAARQWLMNSRLLQAKAASKAGYSGRLSEVVMPSALIKLYRAMGWLCQRVTQKKLLLLIDEGESFSRIVDEDAQVHIGAGLRELFDPENNDAGVFLGLTTPRVRRGTHPMLRADVHSRVGDRHWNLQPLNTPHRIQQFLLNVWSQITAEPTSYTFLLEPAAVQLIATRLDEFCRILLPADQLMADPTQRNLLHVLSVLGASAVETNTQVPIRARVIADWLGLKVT